MPITQNGQTYYTQEEVDALNRQELQSGLSGLPSLDAISGGAIGGSIPSIPSIPTAPATPTNPTAALDGLSQVVAAGSPFQRPSVPTPPATPELGTLPSLGIGAAAIAQGVGTVQGANDLLKGRDSSLFNRGSLALSSFGLSEVARPFISAFGSGKGKDQQERDTAREALLDAGIANTQEGSNDIFVTLADGSQASIGQDGGASFVGYDGESQFSSAYDIDTSHPLHNEATALIDPLVNALFPGSETARVGMATQLTNAVLSNAETIEDVKANVGAIYKSSGISPADLRGNLNELQKGGSFDEGTNDVFQRSISELTGRSPQTGGGLQGGGQTVQGNILWKPQSESDGNLVVLFPYSAGNVVIKDAKTGDILDTGRSTGPSNGYADTVRFSKPGSAFRDVILEDAAGNKIPISDGSQRIEGLTGSGPAGSLGGVDGILSNIGGGVSPSSSSGTPRNGGGRGGRRKGGKGSSFQVAQAPKEQVPIQPDAKTVDDFKFIINEIKRINQGG